MSRKYLSITKGLFPNNHWDVNFWKHMRYEQSQYSTVVNGTLQINTHLYITTSCLLLQDRYLCQYYFFIKNVCLSPQLGDDNIMEISFETILNTGTSRVIYRANLKQGQCWRASTRASQKVLTNVSTYVEVFGWIIETHINDMTTNQRLYKSTQFQIKTNKCNNRTY